MTTIAQKLEIIAENQQKLYESGRQAQYDDFWDKYQNNHNPTYCKNQYAGKGWNYDTFYPKYDIKPKVGQSMFQEFGGTQFSLTERLNECGVTLDTSQCTSFNYMFYGTPFTEVPHIDTRSASSLPQIYQISRNIKKASMTLKDDGSQSWTNAFGECNALEDFTITSGTIGKNGFDIHWSTKLSKASLISILNACNIDVTASPVTITLPSKCIDGATDTKTLLESLGGNIKYTESLKNSTGQLRHTNITPNSVIITPYGPDGNQCNAEWTDDGNGNIINPYYPTEGNMHIMGTINYETGKCTLPAYSEGFQESVKIQYRVESPYTKALALGYNIVFA